MMRSQDSEKREKRTVTRNTALPSIRRTCTVQCSTGHHSTVQYSTVQHLARRDGADADGGDDEVVEGPGPDDQIGPKLVVLKPAGHYPQDCEEDLKCFLASKKKFKWSFSSPLGQTLVPVTSAV